MNIFNEEELAAELEGCDAVVSCLGFKPKRFSKITGYTDTIKVITSAMVKASVSRLVVMSCWGAVRKFV